MVSAIANSPFVYLTGLSFLRRVGYKAEITCEQSMYMSAAKKRGAGAVIPSKSRVTQIWMLHSLRRMLYSHSLII